MQSVKAAHRRRSIAKSTLDALELLKSDGVTQPSQVPLDAFLVGFEGSDDPDRPSNWSSLKRAACIALVGQVVALASFASAAFAPASDIVAAECDCSSQIAYLGTSAYLVGLAFGALAAAPLSEMKGRLPLYVLPLALFPAFQAGSAVLPATLSAWPAFVSLRFLAGLCGSTSQTIASGSLADLLDARSRTIVFPLFAATSFLGPILGVTLGGLISASTAGWRWTQWLLVVWGSCLFLLTFCFMPETYEPAILELRATALNRQCKTDRFITPTQQQMGRRASFNWDYMLHAAQMFLQEPIVFFMSLYIALVYLVLYTTFSSYNIVFQVFNFSAVQISLAFLSIGIGSSLPPLFSPIIQKQYDAHLQAVRENVLQRGENMPSTVLPAEARLHQLCWACWLLPGALFVVAFANHTAATAWPTLAAGIPFGTAILFIYISAYQYMIDIYGDRSSSALASNNFLRYMVSAGMVHAAVPMTTTLGVVGAYAILAAMSLLMCTVPFALLRYGKKLRQMSHFAPTARMGVQMD